MISVIQVFSIHYTKLSITNLFSDGRSDNQTLTWQAAVAARAAGIHVVTVGVGGNVDTDELQGMASYPSLGNTFIVEDFALLNDIRDELVDTACNSKY